jgi:2-succinyl-5-enolpyruvyl-6-hydroxy-3-cyclohexene-1-carboxylate synthase
MKTNYTNETNTLLLVSLLKSHGIKWVIASPGATNVSFVASVQNDSYFKVISAVDERSAAFMACGLVEETGESVVLSCTGATASRNYIPGLTEAYYRHLPILAITSTLNTGRIGYYVPQLLDRSVQYTDMVKLSIQFPSIHSQEDLQIGEVSANKAILELKHRLPGPVHINLATEYSYDFSVKTLREYRVIKRITLEDNFPIIPNGKIGIFIGAHLLMTESETKAIDTFCKKHNGIVLCDQTSNYRGRYRVLANLANAQEINISSKNFDLIIHIGYVSGAYISFTTNEVWRVNPDGELRDLFGKLKYVFEMNEIDFFGHYSFGKDMDDSLITRCKSEREELVMKIGDLPFSNIWIAKETAARLPEHAVLHLGILNSLRAWNFFETPATVACYSNTGGFGIDGCMSSIIGAALVALQKQFYLVLGDLAFFYDLNSLCNPIPNNIHILIINNGLGVEFKNYNHRVALFGDDADDYMAACGHNGKKSSSLIKNYAVNLGIEYYSAQGKAEYTVVRDKWMTVDGKPSILEVFTEPSDESRALEMMNSLIIDYKNMLIQRLKKSKLAQTVLKVTRR